MTGCICLQSKVTSVQLSARQAKPAPIVTFIIGDLYVENFKFYIQSTKLRKKSFLIIFHPKIHWKYLFCCSMVPLVLCFYFFTPKACIYPCSTVFLTFLNTNQYFLHLFTCLLVILVQHSWSMIIDIWIFEFFGVWTNLSLRQFAIFF